MIHLRSSYQRQTPSDEDDFLSFHNNNPSDYSLSDNGSPSDNNDYLSDNDFHSEDSYGN